MLLDQQCLELLTIVDALSKLAEEASEKDSGAIARGLCAAYYRLARSGKSMATIAEQALSTINALSADSVGDATTPTTWKQLQKVRDHQNAVRDFAATLRNDCGNDLIHLTSEIEVILEHPFVVADDSFHYCLQAMHDALEEHVEWFYKLSDQLNAHPVLSIAAQ